MGEAKNIYFTCLKLKRKLFVGVDKLRNLLGLKKKTLSKNGGRGDDASSGGGVVAWHRQIQSRASDHAGSLRQCAGAGSHLRPRSQPDRAETQPVLRRTNPLQSADESPSHGLGHVQMPHRTRQAGWRGESTKTHSQLRHAARDLSVRDLLGHAGEGSRVYRRVWHQQLWG